MADRSHLSIGEVLSLLQDEFPDITISKIRFLESQGLVDPERTPSGYRKFYEEDIERLRWVLRQQRDSFLPLKVIKGRLEGQGRLALEDAGEPGTQEEAGAPPPSPAVDSAATGASHAGQAVAEGSAEQSRRVGGVAAAGTSPATATPPQPAVGEAEVLGTSLAQAGSSSPPSGLEGGRGASAATHANGPSAGRRPRAQRAGTTKAARGEAATSGPQEGPAVVGPRGDEMSVEELVEASGVGIEMVRELERYGLIAPRVVGGTPYYSYDAAAIARLAGAFARHGVEARHLRAYKGAADREAGLVQQVVMPLVRQRNPEAKRAASQAVAELSTLGGELRAVLLREALADLR